VGLSPDRPTSWNWKQTTKTKQQLTPKRNLIYQTSNMAVVRDPSFWKRFSMAVHLDEERNAAVSSSDRPELKHTYVSFAQTKT